MQILNYTLQSAQNTADPKQRAQMLLNAVIEQARTVQLIAQILDAAEHAAMSIENPSDRTVVLRSVEKVMDRMGYDAETGTFQIKTDMTARQPLANE